MENTTTSVSFTVKEKFPSKSVTVPLLESFTTTFTPGRGIPSAAEVTVPDMVLSWACSIEICRKDIKKAIKAIFLLMSILVNVSLILAKYIEFKCGDRNY